MPGILKDDSVTVPDRKEGSTLYNKGNYGYPRSGGGVDLDLLEAAYLMESRRLEVLDGKEGMTFEALFLHSSGVLDDFDIKYMVYRDIRQRGFVVKPETGRFDLSVFPRGMTQSNSRPQYMVRAVSERTAFDTEAFSQDRGDPMLGGRQLLYGIVDEEGDVTYYSLTSKDPRGNIPVSSAGTAEGVLIRDRVSIFDPRDAERIHGNGYFGKNIAGSCQLSLIESCYLMERGLLSVRSSSGKEMDTAELIGFGRAVQNEFPIRLRAFSDLREKGLLVKTGFKYGTHFRVYEDHPDRCHARYLVHVVDGGEMTWPEISRAVRLTGGVKKELLLCRVSDDIEYMEFKWFRP